MNKIRCLNQTTVFRHLNDVPVCKELKVNKNFIGETFIVYVIMPKHLYIFKGYA